MLFPKIVKYNAAWWVSEALRDYGTKVHFVTGGLGSGKTHGSVDWHYAMCTQNQDAKFSWFTEPVFARVKDTAIPKWLNLFQRIDLRENVHWTMVHGNPTVIRLCSGQEIHILSAHNPELLVGAEVSHFTMDEPGKTKYEAFLQCMGRLRDPAAYRRQALLCGSPEGTNWFMDLGDFQGLNLEKLYRRFQLHTADNRANLPPDYIDQLIVTWAAFPARLKAYLYGVFGSFFEGQCITEFDEAVALDADVGLDPEEDIYLSFDFNAYPLAYVIVQVQKFPLMVDGKIFNVRNFVVLGESVSERGGNLEDAAASFVKKVPPAYFRRSPIRLYGDRTGHAASHKVKHTDYEQLVNFLTPHYDTVEICAAKQIAPQVDAIEEVNRLFSYQLVRVHPRCTNFINSLKKTSWKEGTREIDKPKNDKHTHWLDAFKYLAYWLKDLDILNAKRAIVYGVNY